MALTQAHQQDCMLQQTTDRTQHLKYGHSCTWKPISLTPCSLLTISSITNYNLVISVLSMFLLLVKATMYMLHILPPVVSTVLHAFLIALYSVAVAYQASSDTSDPTRLQRGPPWYITKSCSVTLNKSLIGYCKQAKATFACFAAMLAVFCVYFLISLWSCFPSKTQKEEYAEKRKAKKLRWAQADEPEPRTAKSTSYPVPDTPGFQNGMTPATPRTIAFNTLGGTKDLPLRTPEGKTATQTATFALRSPGIMRTPMTLGPVPSTHKAAESSRAISPEPQMYFPPPPKESVRK